MLCSIQINSLVPDRSGSRLYFTKKTFYYTTAASQPAAKQGKQERREIPFRSQQQSSRYLVGLTYSHSRKLEQTSTMVPMLLCALLASTALLAPSEGRRPPYFPVSFRDCSNLELLQRMEFLRHLEDRVDLEGEYSAGACGTIVSSVARLAPPFTIDKAPNKLWSKIDRSGTEADS